MSNRGSITIGRIDYANAWPIFQNHESFIEQASYRTLKSVPSDLNAALRSGELDVSAVSSFAYGEHSEDYVLLPDLSVSSKGKVHSILLFLKKPLSEVLSGTIALTSASATSITLLKIIISMYYGGNPVYKRAAPVLDEMLESADAALLIGDPAIRAYWQNKGYEVIDLGELWHKWTGLGMTYAVVAVRRDAALAEPAAIADVHQSLLAAKSYNLQHPELLAAKACAEIGGSPSYWNTYFNDLKYSFDTSQQEGLALYFRYAKQLGLLERDVHMTFLEDQSALQVNE
ncbi:menaquinone biosynthesis protein [Paenibacillus sp. GCM10023252]|uniref:menaquinone biosynthesis protein n=1 Tax=Paenibacillus sp. GCM10023252 TaxID=3252649 RepID=UPI00361CDF77